MIKVITDCKKGVKYEAIRGVFSGAFQKNPTEIEIVTKGESFTTPMTKDDFILVTTKRIQQLRKNYDNPDVFAATIQKGYYYSGGLWQLAACVAIAGPLLSPITLMTSSVAITGSCSEKKSLDLNENMSDIISVVYPEWDKEEDSVYKLFTGEEEVLWLQQPLRHCLRAITRPSR